jgi:alpha-maltose-1-phosphate synthase
MPGSSCALYYTAEAYEGDQPGVVGRQSAGAGFLEALVRYGGQSELFCLTNQQAHFDEFRRKVSTLAPDPPPSTWIHPDDMEFLGRAGCVYNPGPIVAEMAWMRRYSNERLFSICGITHSLATDRAIRGIRDFLTAPTQPWDALVCTSRSGLAAVERIIASWSEYLGRRGFQVPESPMRSTVIPLGVNLERFRRDEAAITRGRALRAKLGIGEDDVAGLYFGRLNILSKAHPTPMYRAFELAQRTMPAGRLHLILAGQFADPRVAAQFDAARRRFAPSVRVHWVNGNDAADAAASWFAADFFISLTDNIQETFGLTPVEAMAASLPCIVSDWDGYRETVVDGHTGFLIPTLTPPPGAGIELADQVARRAYDHFSYIGLVSQSTAVDIDACARAIMTLAGDADLRGRMGEAARRRAETVYDWRIVMQQYLELWNELAALRAAAPMTGARRPTETVHPDYPDPFSLFRANPTRVLESEDEVRLADLDGRFLLEQLRKNALHTFATPSLLEASLIDAIVVALESGPQSVAQLDELVATTDHARVLRTIAWLYKYGIVSVARTNTPVARTETARSHNRE